MSSLDSSEDLVAKARNSEWGFIEFGRGKVLFVRLNSTTIILVEPTGGYFFPDEQDPKQLIPMPDEKTLASILSGVSLECLDTIAAFASEPRTMKEIEAVFEVEAWRLRRLGLLKDVGRKDRRIISRWAGYDLNQLVTNIFRLAATPPRSDDSL